MIRIKGKYVDQKLELERALELPEGSEGDILLNPSAEALEKEAWMQLGMERLQEEWDNPQDAIYDNWKKLYGLQLT